MIEPIINYANNNLQDLALFQDIKGLCEMVTESQNNGEVDIEIKYPAYYNGDDNLESISDLDYKQGVVFHMVNGDLSESELEQIRVRSRYIERRYPVKLIAIVRRDILNTDTAYSPDEVVNNIISQISDRNIISLRTQLGADKVSIDVRSANTKKDEILEATFFNVEIEGRHDLIVVSVDYEIVVTGNENCLLKTNCN